MRVKINIKNNKKNLKDFPRNPTHFPVRFCYMQFTCFYVSNLFAHINLGYWDCLFFFFFFLNCLQPFLFLYFDFRDEIINVYELFFSGFRAYFLKFRITVYEIKGSKNDSNVKVVNTKLFWKYLTKSGHKHLIRSHS